MCAGQPQTGRRGYTEAFSINDPAGRAGGAVGVTMDQSLDQRLLDYQIILILEGVVQGGDPLAISIYQHVTFLPKARRLQKKATALLIINHKRTETCKRTFYNNQTVP